MKTTTKLLASAMFIAAIFFGNNANAQMTKEAAPNPWRFGIGLETGMPTGKSLSNLTGWALGGTARVQYEAAPSLYLMLTSGYYNFFVGNNISNVTTTSFGNSTYATKPHDLGVIPVKAGLKGFVGNSIYFSAEAGVGFETKYNQDKKLILAPGFGWADKSWDVGVRYENYSGQSNNYGLVGLRLAYGFGL